MSFISELITGSSNLDTILIEKLNQYIEKVQTRVSAYVVYKCIDDDEPLLKNQFDIIEKTNVIDDLTCGYPYIGVTRIFVDIVTHGLLYTYIFNGDLIYDTNILDYKTIFDRENLMIEILNDRISHALVIKEYTSTLLNCNSRAFIEFTLKLIDDFFNNILPFSGNVVFGSNIISNIIVDDDLKARAVKLSMFSTYLSWEIFHMMRQHDILTLWNDISNSSDMNEILDITEILVSKLNNIPSVIYKMYKLVYVFVPLMSILINQHKFSNQILDKLCLSNDMAKHITNRKRGSVHSRNSKLIHVRYRSIELTKAISNGVLDQGFYSSNILLLFNILISESNINKDLLKIFKVIGSDYEPKKYKCFIVNPITNVRIIEEDAIFEFNQDILMMQ
jgi:hypothetical protein